MPRVKVMKVTDGDGFRNNKGNFYRLAGVKAPEKRKRGYQKAKNLLKELIEGKTVFCETVGQSYGRKVVKVRLRGKKKTVNETMRRKGYK